jgi:DNA-3-methyladenine glycosylase
MGDGGAASAKGECFHSVFTRRKWAVPSLMLLLPVAVDCSGEAIYDTVRRKEKVVPLPREFYLRDAVVVARDLLGCRLMRRVGGKLAGGIIVETEAYLGQDDPGSHAFRGLTHRNAPMWAIGGTAYVYRIYGVHCCLNVVTGPQGIPQAVLIRAIQPTLGVEIMQHNRECKDIRQLASGPAKLCQALGIDTRLNWADLTAADLFIAPPQGATPSPESIVVTTRVGLSRNRGEDRLLRFCLTSCPYVSRPRASPGHAAVLPLADGPETRK